MMTAVLITMTEIPATMIKEIFIKPASVPRHELKYRISHTDDFLLTKRLRRLFDHDTHAGSHGSYRVSSLYFDSPFDKALRQKLDGVNRREKFRIRYYGTDLRLVRLEKKIKINGLCSKYSAVLTREETENILSGHFDFLLFGKNPLLQEFYSKLRGELLTPKTVVRYDREAFLFPAGNVRITIDRNLRGDLNPYTFLGAEPPSVPMLDGLSVLEIKYDQFLPEIVKMAVQVPGRKTEALSKYAICRQKIE